MIRKICLQKVDRVSIKISCTVPMFIVFCIIFLSTLSFVLANSFNILWSARALQGVRSDLPALLLSFLPNIHPINDCFLFLRLLPFRQEDKSSINLINECNN